MKVLDCDINQVIDLSANKHGVYLFYKVKNNRSINPKSKRKADELLIVGMPHKAFQYALNKGKYKIIGVLNHE